MSPCSRHHSVARDSRPRSDRLCLDRLGEEGVGREHAKGGRAMAKARKTTAKAPTRQGSVPFLRFEYVTGTVSTYKGDGIVAHVLNDSATTQHTRVIIYQNTGAGAVVSVDSGVTAIALNWMWSLGFTVPSSGEYWVRVAASTDVVVPKVSFERSQPGLWVPVVTYRPGDFAVFDRTPTRHRLW